MTLVQKRSGKHKARWVADGSSDHANVPSSSPTCASTSLMLILAMAAQFGWKILTLDVVGAYLLA